MEQPLVAKHGYYVLTYTARGSEPPQPTITTSRDPGG